MAKIHHVTDGARVVVHLDDVHKVSPPVLVDGGIQNSVPSLNLFSLLHVSTIIYVKS